MLTVIKLNFDLRTDRACKKNQKEMFSMTFPEHISKLCISLRGSRSNVFRRLSAASPSAITRLIEENTK